MPRKFGERVQISRVGFCVRERHVDVLDRQGERGRECMHEAIPARSELRIAIEAVLLVRHSRDPRRPETHERSTIPPSQSATSGSVDPAFPGGGFLVSDEASHKDERHRSVTPEDSFAAPKCWSSSELMTSDIASSDTLTMRQ